MTVDPDKVAKLVQRARSVEDVPSYLRCAKDAMPAFEHRAVKAVMQWSGCGSISELKREAARWGTDGFFTFSMFREVVRDFPVRFTAGRLRFHFDDVATQLFNDPTNTKIWSAYSDARERIPDGRLALIFAWPRVRKCHNLCVFHACDRDESELEGVTRRKDDPRLAFRLTVPIAGKFHHVEPLPAFLYAMGRYAGVQKENDA